MHQKFPRNAPPAASFKAMQAAPNSASALKTRDGRARQSPARRRGKPKADG